ncbi:MAG: aminotransferase class IV [Methanobacteriota archaeon]
MPLADRGLLYGDGVFETVRIHGGAPFRLDRHLDRLVRGLRTLRIEAPARLTDIGKGARALVAACGMTEGLLRITVTAADGDPPARTSIVPRDLPSRSADVSLHVVECVRRTPGPLSACKTISRALESAALREARAHGAFDGVILNDAGRVAETTSRNLFLVHGGGLVTPPASEGALEGVTRGAVLELAGKLGVPTREAPVPREALERADEVVLTGSGVGVLAVRRVGSHAWARVPGPTAASLAAAYRELLNADARW